MRSFDEPREHFFVEMMRRGKGAEDEGDAVRDPNDGVRGGGKDLPCQLGGVSAEIRQRGKS